MDKNELIAAMWESELPPLAKLIFLAILDYRNAKTGDCYPSIETIASKTGIGRTTVISSVKIIDGLGFFTIKKVRPKYAKFTINSYIFNFDSSPDERSKQHSNDSSKHGSKHGSPPEPKPIELIEHKIVKDKSLTIPDGISAPSNWELFLKFRKEIKKPVTQTQVDGLIRKADKLAKQSGCDPSEILQQSIDNGWQGIFELKKGNINGSKRQSPHDKLQSAWQSVLEDADRRQQDKLGQLQMAGTLALPGPGNPEELDCPY